TEYIGKEKKQKTKKSNAQDAHEAIRPTSVMRKPEELKSFLGRDQLRLYKLIWERFVASQMASAIMDTVTARLINNNVQFRASGSVVKFPGFMKVDVESKVDGAEEKDKMLPPLPEGEAVLSKYLETKQPLTQL
ncbi:DNA topoisomerase, partial [Bacillus cereus]|uniref:DNA topoisomerase n=1 Tax=Bacillus cereus TaxID=1396 RepID=UPI00284AD686